MLNFAVGTAVLGGGYLVFAAEVSAENGRIGESCLGHNLGDGQVGCDEQLAGKLQTQVVDKLGQGVVFAALREGRAHALFGDVKLVHDHLPVERRVEEQQPSADLVLDVVEKFFGRKRIE